MMTPALLIVLLIAFILVVGLMLIWHEVARRQRATQASYDWQLEKMRRFANGWRPSLWDEGASDDEKLVAIQRYIKGDTK